MITLGICIFIIMLGIFVGRNAKESSGRDFFRGLCVFFGTIGLFTAVVFMGVYFISYKGEIQEFNSVKQTIEVARANNTPLESAAIQHKVVDVNKWLASTKYYNSIVFFDDFIPDEVEDLEPIK